MSVTIRNLAEVKDEKGEVLFTNEDHLLPQVVFSDVPAMSGSGFDRWWLTVEPLVRRGLGAYFLDPPTETVPQALDSAGARTFTVIVPISHHLLHDPAYDVLEEVLPEVREAVLVAESRSV